MAFRASVGAINGSSDFDDVYPWSHIRLCNVQNGVVIAYQGEPGFTRTPGAGIDVMVELPAFYYKVLDNAALRDIDIIDLVPTFGFTNKPDGYEISPRHAPYPAQPNGHRVAYIGAYTCGTDYRSVSGGNSVVSITRATARNGCSNRGATYWQYDIATWATVCLLYQVEVADLNSQRAVGRGHVDNSPAAQLARGHSDNVAGHSGGNGANTASKYRNIENFWGNIWNWCDGINFNGAVTHINLNPATYADDTANNYTQLGYNKAVADGWIRTTGFDPNIPWLHIPIATTGADDQFLSDYYWQSTGWRVLILGGAWPYTGRSGVFCFGSSDAASLVYASIGCRLVVLPPAAA